MHELDECQVCMGMMGGVPGNCNIIRNGPCEVTICDYCSVRYNYLSFSRPTMYLNDKITAEEVIAAVRYAWAEHFRKRRKGD